jgi:hypothetical protein
VALQAESRQPELLQVVRRPDRPHRLKRRWQRIEEAGEHHHSNKRTVRFIWRSRYPGGSDLISLDFRRSYRCSSNPSHQAILDKSHRLGWRALRAIRVCTTLEAAQRGAHRSSLCFKDFGSRERSFGMAGNGSTLLMGGMNLATVNSRCGNSLRAGFPATVRADYLASVFSRASAPASPLPQCARQHSLVLPDAKTDDDEGEQPVSLTEQLTRSLVWAGPRLRHRIEQV